MTEFVTVTEIDNVADAAAFGTALENTLVNDHGMTLEGDISGETESRVFKSTGLNNRFANVKSGKESILIEAHNVSGEEWAASAGIEVIGAGPFTGLVNRTALKTLYPRYGSSTERIIIASDGRYEDLDLTGLEHEFRFTEAGVPFADTAGSDNITTLVNASVVSDDVGFGNAIQKNSDGARAVTGTIASAATYGGGSGTVFTYEIRFRRDALEVTDEGTLFTQIPETSSFRFVFEESNESLTIDGVGSFAFSFGVGVWYNIAVILDKINLNAHLYVGGAFQETLPILNAAASDPSATMTNLRFLSRVDSGGDTRTFNGTIGTARFWSRGLTAIEIDRINQHTTDDSTIIKLIDEPSWVNILTHNTVQNAGVGKFNPVVLGLPRRPGGREPFLTTLATAAAALDTTLDLVDPIFNQMDPDQNSAAPTNIWLTNLETGATKKIKITGTSTTLSIPEVTDPDGDFPAGSLVSDLPYELITSDLVDDASLKHFDQSSQASLVQSFNGNYGGTIVDVYGIPINGDNFEHWYNFNQSDGSDSIGAVTLTNNGGAFPVSAVGPKFGKSYTNTDEAHELITTAADTTFAPNGASPWTISFRLKVPATILSGTRFMSFYNGATNNITVLLDSTSKEIFLIGAGGLSQKRGLLVENSTTHFSFVYDGANISIYQDGVLQGTSFAFVGYSGVDTFSIGSDAGSTGWLKGFEIDDVQLWSREWSLSEIITMAAYDQDNPQRLGTIPDIRAHGTDAGFTQAEVVHREREDLGGSFNNNRLWKHPGDDTNFYSMTRGA